MNPLSNGSNLMSPCISPPSHSPPTSFPQSSSSNVKFLNSHSRFTTSLSQMVINSVNQEVPSTDSYFPVPTTSTTTTTVSQTSIAHKIGVNGSRGKNSHKHSETPLPESLLVRIPRSHVLVNSALSRTHEVRSDKAETKEVNDHGIETVRLSEQSRMPETELRLIVSIDVSLLNSGRSASNPCQAQTGSDIKPNRTEQVIENHCPPGKLELLSTHHIDSRHDDTGDYRPMETDTSPLFGNGEVPLTGPQLVPPGASPGVDGCMGNDGCWYAWTDMIPGHDEAVTVLPYIYIDGDSDNLL